MNLAMKTVPLRTLVVLQYSLSYRYPITIRKEERHCGIQFVWCFACHFFAPLVIGEYLVS